MKYKAMPGTIHTSVCGSHYLVNNKLTVEINETTAFYWKLLEKGTDKEDLILSITENYEIDNIDLVRKDLDNLLQFLLDKHMIMRYSK